MGLYSSKNNSRVSAGPDEVETTMHSEVGLLLALRLLFLSHVSLVLVIDEIDDRGPRITVVDIVAESRGVNDTELDFELFLLKLRLDDLDLGQLVELLVVTPRVILGRRQLGGEERVDKSGLAKTGFTYIIPKTFNVGQTRQNDATHRRPSW